MTQHLTKLLKEEQEQHGFHLLAIKETQLKLNSFREGRYTGATVQARAQKLLSGKQPTSRAVADERKYALDKNIFGIEHCGVITNDKDIIKLASVEYYKHLLGGCDMPENVRSRVLFSLNFPGH